MTIIKSNCLPTIKQYFNPNLLLSTLERLKYNVNNKILPLAMKKLQNCPGRQAEIDKLLDKFMSVYERKEIEEADYKAKNKKKIEERSCISISSRTMCFRRLPP
jgi:hypothetical protein